MCFKAGCTVKSHTDNMLLFNTLAVSPLVKYVFICVKGKEDSMLWTATTLPFEVVAKDWDHLQDEKRPLA